MNQFTTRCFQHPETWFIILCLSFSTSSCSAQVTESFTEPFHIRNVAASEPGAVSETFVEQGQAVESGQILAELQCEDLKQKKNLAQLRAASAHAVNSANAVLQIRKRQKETLAPMLASGHANQAEVEKSEMDYEAAHADWQAALQAIEEHRIEVDLIQAEIGKRTIRSPISGVVTEVHRKAGEFISSAEPTFATVADLSRLRVRFYLLAETAQSLIKSQPVDLLTGTDKRSCTGKVEFVSPITDPDSGTTRVEVIIDNSDFSLRSGSRCVWKGLSPDSATP